VNQFVRGVAWPAVSGAPYPRADLTDVRLPIDTAGTAMLPAGVRLELVGDATHVDIGYETTTDQLGYRGTGAGTTFSSWSGEELVDEQPAVLGRGSVRVRLAAGRTVIHLPEGMKPVVTDVVAVGGTIEPAPPEPRWIAYGDSITEGWVASGPARAWPAIAGRRHGLDVVNMGYAGSARGETVSAEHIAGVDCDVVSLAHGTNCWSRWPHTAAMLRATTEAFIGIIRSTHPEVPIVVCSPIVRLDAEDAPNLVGATLADLRAAVEDAAEAAGVTLVPGRELLAPDLLPDGIHPGDEGHRILADIVGGAVAAAVRGLPSGR
jgi:lysophospholipase L1-like esterase